MKLLLLALDVISILGWILLALSFVGLSNGIFELIIGGLDEAIYN